MKQLSIDILKQLIDDNVKLRSLEDKIVEAVELLKEGYQNGNKVLVCGNGGSAADALHIVGELMKGFRLDRGIKTTYQEKIREMLPDYAELFIENLQEALPTISLVNEISLTTAYANDKAADLSFAQQVYGYGTCGDILVAISTSGNSKNVLYAAQIAQVKGMKVISLTGKTGGALASESDVLLNVHEEETYKIQELHLPVYHCLCAMIENEMFT